MNGSLTRMIHPFLAMGVNVSRGLIHSLVEIKEDVVRYYKDPGVLLSGNPPMFNWTLYDSVNFSLSTGIWESQPGKWRVAYTEWEWCVIQHGKCSVVGDDGSIVSASAGDSFVIEPGFVGTWEVIEPVRKLWVIRTFVAPTVAGSNRSSGEIK